jgi:hydrogenase expression/formation protein HypD
MLQSIYMLVKMFEEGRHGVEIQYKRVVSKEGNTRAQEAVRKVFEPSDDTWRGLGLIPGSGLKIRKEYSRFDASVNFDIRVDSLPEPAGCLCGEVLRGVKSPTDCRLFAKVCTPVNPIGACMVSGEGACQAFYRYRQ